MVQVPIPRPGQACQKMVSESQGFQGVLHSLEVFRNEILSAWQKDLNVEVILISEFMNRNKNHFYKSCLK